VRVFMAQNPRQLSAFIHMCFTRRAQAVKLPPFVPPAAYMLDTLYLIICFWVAMS